MTRYIATVEHDAGEYWIRFPGIEKAERTDRAVPERAACRSSMGPASTHWASRVRIRS